LVLSKKIKKQLDLYSIYAIYFYVREEVIKEKRAIDLQIKGAVRAKV